MLRFDQGATIRGLPPDVICTAGVFRHFREAQLRRGLNLAVLGRLAIAPVRASTSDGRNVKAQHSPADTDETTIGVRGLERLADSAAGPRCSH